MTYNITLAGTPLSPAFSGTLEQLHQAILAGITGTISSGDIIIGKVGGSMPVTNVGPWLNGRTWYVWDGATYVPATVAVGNGTFEASISGAPTANRTITIQDKDGTIALLSDVYTPRVTHYPAIGATTTIDWSVSNSFGLPLNQSTTLAMANSVSGQEIYIVAYNGPGLLHAINWPSNVKWPGAAPGMSTNDKADVYVLRNVGGQIYGQALQAYA